MAPLFEHYGVQLWMPEVGGRVDYASEHDEKTMAVQTREQGRYLGGRPPYGYRLADAGPHPNKRTPRGAGERTAWTPIRRPRRPSGGSSSSAWPGIR
jgi:hypothetical protein